MTKNTYNCGKNNVFRGGIVNNNTRSCCNANNFDNNYTNTVAITIAITIPITLTTPVEIAIPKYMATTATIILVINRKISPLVYSANVSVNNNTSSDAYWQHGNIVSIIVSIMLLIGNMILTITIVIITTALITVCYDVRVLVQ